MPWHAIYVNSRAEKKVTDLLQTKRVEAYLPLKKELRQWKDRKKTIEFPLINGYVFVNISPLQNEIVLQTKGVISFVKSEGKIAVIREVEITRLKQLIELGYQIEVGEIKSHYKEGDKIKITSGVLKGMEGYVVENKENRYIDVLLENIKQSIRVKLPKELVLSI